MDVSQSNLFNLGIRREQPSDRIGKNTRYLNGTPSSLGETTETWGVWVTSRLGAIRSLSRYVGNVGWVRSTIVHDHFTDDTVLLEVRPVRLFRTSFVNQIPTRCWLNSLLVPHGFGECFGELHSR